MALVFNDTQIKNISKDALDLPLIINDPINGTGLVQKKAQAISDKASILATDNQNKVFSDNWIATLEAYHNELKELNLSLRTNYLDSYLVDGGKLLTPHYTTTWPNIAPILLASNNGNPVGSYGGPKEQDKIDDVEYYKDLLLNGFSYGSTDSTLFSAYTTGSGQIELNSGTLSVNDWIIIDDSGDSTLFTVTGITGYCTGEASPPQLTEPACTGDGGTWHVVYNISPLSGDTNNFPINARVRNFHAGFSNNDRGRVTTNYAFDVQVYFETNLSNEVTDYKNFLNSHKAFLDANGDTVSSRKALNDAEKTSLQTAINDFIDWDDEPVSSATGKYTDTKLPLVTNNLTARTAKIPTRITEITNNLGSISQAGNGDVTGTGAYLSLWEFILIRIGRAGGTLIQYNNSDIIVNMYDSKIAVANSTLNSYLDTFAIATISLDTVIGQITFTVNSVVDFSIGQQVKVMDNSSVVYTRTISNIVGNNITLNSGIPAALTVGNQARIVRQK
jgi:hypothetical protein